MSKGRKATTAAKDPLDASWRAHMVSGEWLPDISADRCMICKLTFTFWYRRHHCRRCGAVVCASCSAQKSKFASENITPSNAEAEPVRVCDACLKAIDRKLAQGVAQHMESHKTRTIEPCHKSEKSKVSRDLDCSAHNVVSIGSYRAEIKESEGNRYIQDTDL